MPEAVSALIFDLDGTLIDSKDVMRNAYFTAYEEVVGDNAPPPFSEYCRYLGQSFPTIMRQMGLPMEMHAVFMRESVRNMRQVSLFEGVLPMLEELKRRKVPLAIATGKDHARAAALLEYLEVDRHFAMVVGSDDVPYQKPAPDMALSILRRLDLNPAETLFIGDAVADLACGRNAGVMTALAKWDRPAAEVLMHPADFHLEHPSDILSLLREPQKCRLF